MVDDQFLYHTLTMLFHLMKTIWFMPDSEGRETVLFKAVRGRIQNLFYV
jgi:hypothetical protein